MVSNEGYRKLEEQMGKLGVLEKFKAGVKEQIELEDKMKKDNKERTAEEGGRSCGNQDCQGKGRQRCSDCNFVYYCSRKCQAKAWGEHKVECREIQKEFKTVMVKKVGALPPGH